MTDAEYFAVSEEPEAAAEGAQAYEDGIYTNPYPAYSTEWFAWFAGRAIAKANDDY